MDEGLLQGQRDLGERTRKRPPGEGGEGGRGIMGRKAALCSTKLLCVIE